MEEGEENKSALLKSLNFMFNIADHVILVIIAVGIIYLAARLIFDAYYDALMLWTAHTIPHLLSEMMFALITMELFRQVWRQINKHEFSLNPYLYIGFIASIRGLLLTQMAISMDDVLWDQGTIQMVVHGVILLILVVCYILYNKQKLPEKS
ncbi:MAG: hypothetical protein IT392_05235 [Nitrospirae bacterium]|nr:hypothetical protein [Nitrospirota bacterium]